MAKLQLRPNSQGLFQCPECEYQNREPGGVRFHHYWNHGEGLKRKKAKPDRCPACGGEWEQLEAQRSAQEAAAMEHGYSKKCKECDELA